MNIKIISDIHLEKSIDPSAIITNLTLMFQTKLDNDVLILAGDIGNPYEVSYNN